MKRTILFLLAAVFLQTALYAEQPLREVRAFWLTTVWSLDWPGTTVPAPVICPEDGVTILNEVARENARNEQKNDLIAILDRLEEANYNTVYFQVRPMSDALYRSSFPEEPWSQWLSSVRGADPGWSPLGFIIEHAHARGIEVHAWLNPLRYASSPATTGNLPTDYINTHPEWIMNYGPHPNGANHHRILNPGIPEVRTRIADIVADIITNYNVDGIVFDDYFYKQRSATQLTQAQFDALDDAQFRAYNPLGRSRADWRRDNINLMIREVNDRINSIAPWVQFGVSPAGVSLNNGGATAGVATRYGIRPGPSGSDWQFAGISAHPVAWLSENTIDYISPQIYWRIGATPNFKLVAEWWAEISNHFGRHFFSSTVSHVPGSPGNIFTTSEMIRQIRVLRNADVNSAPGSVGFRFGNFMPTTLDAFVEDPFRYRALTASFGWHEAPVQGLVQNLNVSGQNVTWTYTNADTRVFASPFSSVRYAVFAIPNAYRNDANVFTSPRFLQGISWTDSFTLADGISPATHAIAVAVFDRFGNLFSPRVLDETETVIPSALLAFPANNQTIMARQNPNNTAQTLIPANTAVPTLFTWEDNDADFWIWQIARDADFTNPVASRETNAPNFNSALQGNLRAGNTYYWRVLSVKANALVSVSEVRSFTISNTTVPANQILRITAPTFGTETASRTPTVTWTNLGAGATYTLEISTSLTFGENEIVFSRTGTATSVDVPSGYLELSTTYHVRVTAQLGGNRFISLPHHFATEFVSPFPPMTVPVIISPSDGETVVGTSIEVTWEEQRSRGFHVERSTRPTFTPMTTQRQTVSALNFNAVFDNLREDTWYIRMRARLDDGANTDWTETIRVQLTREDVSVPIPDITDFFRVYNTSNGNANLVIYQQESTSALVAIHSVTGRLIYSQTHSLNVGITEIPLELSGQARGVYLVQVTVGNRTQTQRIVR